MDAARALLGHGCPFSAGPRSVAEVKEPDEVGPNQEHRTLGYLGMVRHSGFQVTRRRRNSLAVRTDQTLSVTQNSGNAPHTSSACCGPRSSELRPYPRNLGRLLQVLRCRTDDWLSHNGTSAFTQRFSLMNPLLALFFGRRTHRGKLRQPGGLDPAELQNRFRHLPMRWGFQHPAKVA